MSSSFQEANAPCAARVDRRERDRASRSTSTAIGDEQPGGNTPPWHAPRQQTGMRIPTPDYPAPRRTDDSVAAAAFGQQQFAPASKNARRRLRECAAAEP